MTVTAAPVIQRKVLPERERKKGNQLQARPPVGLCPARQVIEVLRPAICRRARTSGALPGNGADFCARIMRMTRGAYLRTAASCLRTSYPT
jgi:hypothetical protein